MPNLLILCNPVCLAPVHAFVPANVFSKDKVRSLARLELLACLGFLACLVLHAFLALHFFVFHASLAWHDSHLLQDFLDFFGLSLFRTTLPFSAGQTCLSLKNRQWLPLSSSHIPKIKNMSSAPIQETCDRIAFLTPFTYAMLFPENALL